VTQHAQVIIRRRNGFVDRLRNYRIVVDERVVGEIGPSTERAIPLAPGPHRIWLTLDSSRSATLELVLGAGESQTLECGPRGVGWLLSLPVLWLRPPTDVWIRLEPAG
jgi:hypothetical protein